jgi:signal transduction histidine kinase
MPQVRTCQIPCVSADADLVHAVLFNLIKNAVKFGSKRGDAFIEVYAASSDRDMVTVCVRDNGVGFDAARADALFKPFSRLNGASYEGCGIGLSIVRQAVERHGGRVWADAVPGQGASFFFTLPAACE